jgi:hypothetical protein
MRDKLSIMSDEDLGRYLDGRPDLAENKTEGQLPEPTAPAIDDEHSILFLRGTPVLPLMRSTKPEEKGE